MQTLFLTLDGEDERRVAVGVLRVNIDPREREQLPGLALPTCGKRERGRLLTRDVIKIVHVLCGDMRTSHDGAQLGQTCYFCHCLETTLWPSTFPTVKVLSPLPQPVLPALRMSNNWQRVPSLFLIPAVIDLSRSASHSVCSALEVGRGRTGEGRD